MSEGAPCPECGFSPLVHYCANCGQKRIHDQDLSFKHVAHNVVHELIHVDGRLWSTLRLLFARPGQLPLDYTQGRRTRHIRPLRLFLVLSLVIIFAQLNSVFSLPYLLQEAGPAWQKVIAWGANQKGIDGTAYLSQRNAVFQTIMRVNNLYVATTLTILMCFLLWRRKRPFFGSHAVFVLYTSCATNLVSSLLAWMSFPWRQQTWAAVAIVSVVYSTVYLTLAARRYYGEGWGRTIINVMTITVLGVINMLLATIIALFVALPVIPYQRSKKPQSVIHQPANPEKASPKPVPDTHHPQP